MELEYKFHFEKLNKLHLFQDVGDYFYHFISGGFNHMVERSEKEDFLNRTADDYIYDSHYRIFESYRKSLKLTDIGEKLLRFSEDILVSVNYAYTLMEEQENLRYYKYWLKTRDSGIEVVYSKDERSDVALSNENFELYKSIIELSKLFIGFKKKNIIEAYCKLYNADTEKIDKLLESIEGKYTLSTYMQKAIDFFEKEVLTQL